MPLCKLSSSVPDMFTISLVDNQTGRLNHHPRLDAKQLDEFLSSTSLVSYDEPLDEDFGVLLQQVSEGLEFEEPELCSEGEGGVYFLRDINGDRVAVFKPDDEDPQADNNPKKKGDSAEQLRASVPRGTCAVREVAAFALDRGFSGVPTTGMVRLTHPNFSSTKSGSLQRYIQHDSSSWDISPYKFNTEDVQRIAILDLRTLNTDRHGGNMLAVNDFFSSKETHRLVPIDHAFTFPTNLSELTSFEWQYWPQAKRPLSEASLRMIRSINMQEDANLLASCGIEPEAIWVNQVGTTLLKIGAASGASLSEMAKVCCRKRNDEPSTLELLCAQAQEDASNTSGDFFSYLSYHLEHFFASPTGSCM